MESLDDLREQIEQMLDNGHAKDSPHIEEVSMKIQKIEWEAYAAEQEVRGICPYSGLQLLPVMDVWNRRMLMCDVCDCFGYPVVMSDGGEEYGRITESHLTGDDLNW